MCVCLFPCDHAYLSHNNIYLSYYICVCMYVCMYAGIFEECILVFV